jgi:hypothetical protein
MQCQILIREEIYCHDPYLWVIGTCRPDGGRLLRRQKKTETFQIEIKKKGTKRWKKHYQLLSLMLSAAG